ncbi:MAG: enoyl-CoA hydratase/isomerase family protein [Promethearchaeota archaeon]
MTLSPYEGYKFFQIEKEKNVLIVRLNRPPVNALSEGVFTELQQIVKTANVDTEVIVIIIASALPNLFTVGADLKELVKKYIRKPKKAIQNLNIGHATYNAIEKSPKPVIIVFKGISYGGGIELACACDIRIASKSAFFAMPETRIAFIPGYGGTQRIPRIIGSGQAKKLILTGEPINAQQALQIGLIDEITPKGKELKRAMQLARFITRGAPISAAFAKRAINEGLNMTLKEALEREKEYFMRNIETQEVMEGLYGFIQKRPPTFKRIGASGHPFEDYYTQNK